MPSAKSVGAAFQPRFVIPEAATGGYPDPRLRGNDEHANRMFKFHQRPPFLFLSEGICVRKFRIDLFF